MTDMELKKQKLDTVQNNVWRRWAKDQLKTHGKLYHDEFPDYLHSDEEYRQVLEQWSRKSEDLREIGIREELNEEAHAEKVSKQKSQGVPPWRVNYIATPDWGINYIAEVENRHRKTNA